jgi:hypothetical protein
MFGHVLGQFYGRSARGRPWPARLMHLTSRELTRRSGGTGVGPADEHCPGGIYQGSGSH